MAEEPTAKRAPKRGLLERLADGVVVGDGGMIWTMEERGYAKASVYSPEVAVENPDAVLQVHREFLHNGADVLQTCTFFSEKVEDESVNGVSINDSACATAKQAAAESSEPILVSGSITKTELYLAGKGKEAVQAEFRRQMETYLKHDLDFLIAEFYERLEEALWAVEVLKESDKPVMATMCIGPGGDWNGVSTEECAVALAKAGADLVGINCRFGPETCLKTMAIVKEALRKANLENVYLAAQPFGYCTPDAPTPQGYTAMREFPFAMEPRAITRVDAYNYAVAAEKLGVRYIGGCCGFQGKHIRSMSEALQETRGIVAPVTKHYGKWIDTYVGKNPVRGDKNFWLKMEPATGRPKSAAYSDHSIIKL